MARSARRIAGVAAALAAGTITLAVASQAAHAYNFPFNGRCGAQWYYDGPSQTMATYSHRDGNKLWYKITWGGRPVHPDPLHHYNWAHCFV